LLARAIIKSMLKSIPLVKEGLENCFYVKIL